MDGRFAHAGSKSLSFWPMPHSVNAWSYSTLLICASSKNHNSTEWCRVACMHLQSRYPKSQRIYAWQNATKNECNAHAGMRGCA